MPHINHKDLKIDKSMASINDYMKRRNYDEPNDVKPDGRLGSAVEERLGIEGIISPSSPNSFTFSTTSSNYSFIEQQYIRLKSWMTEASDPCRGELSQVLFPLFIHLYLELLSGPGKNASKNFFSRHHQVFRVNRDYEQTLRQVFNVSGETANCPVIQTLKSGKYFVHLSELTLNYFLRYLQTSDNPTLLQIFNNYIEVETSELTNTPCQPAIFRPADYDDGYDSRSNSSCQETQEIDCSQEELNRIKDIISKVRNLKPVMPSMCIYSVINAYNGLSCSKVNHDSTQLACGFEDSVIKLWRLTPPTQNIGFESFESTPPEKEIETILFCDVGRSRDSSDSTKVEKEEEEESKNIVSGRHISGGESHTLRGHRGPVYGAAFSDNSPHLFSVGEDATMRLWDLEEGRTISLYEGHHYPVWSIDVAHESVFVATGSYDGTCRLWSPESVYPLRTMAGHGSSVDCIAFHPNCNYIASGSSDRSVRLWQVNNGEVARVMLHHKTPVKAVKFSPDGKYLASGSENGEVLVWDLTAGKVLSSLGAPTPSDTASSTPFPSQQHMEAIVSLDWSKDTRLLISSSAEGYVRANYFLQTDPDLTEVGSVVCGSSHLGGITLTHASMNNQNYLSIVMAVHGER